MEAEKLLDFGPREKCKMAVEAFLLVHDNDGL